MKKWLVQGFVLLLCLALPMCASAEFAFVQMGMDVYAEADFSSRVLSTYSAGTWIEVVEEDGLPADSTFCSVIGPDGLEGYAPMTGLFIPDQVDQSQTVVVANNGKFVNLRAKASKQSSVIAKVNSGTPMLLLEAGKSFDHVLIGDLDGYMQSSLVKIGLTPIFSCVVKSTNGSNVNLRSEPTTNGDVLASMPYGGNVSVYMLGNGWSYVRYGKTDGYMMSKFLSSAKNNNNNNNNNHQQIIKPVDNPDPDSDFWSTGMTCYVSNGGSSVRYRSGPGESASVLGKLASGSEVYELSTNGAWSKITIGYGGRAVYMMSKFLVTIMPIDDDPYYPIIDPVPNPNPYDDDPIIYWDTNNDSDSDSSMDSDSLAMSLDLSE